MFCLEVFPCWAHHRSANTSVELSCLHNGIMRNILSKTLCSFDFTPSDLLGASCKFCRSPTALLRVLRLISISAACWGPPFGCGMHLLIFPDYLMEMSPPEMDCYFLLPCFPAVFLADFYIPLLLGLFKGFFGVWNPCVSLSRESQKTVPGGSLWFTLNFDAWCVFSHAGLVCNTSRSALGQHCVFLFFSFFLCLCYAWFDIQTSLSALWLLLLNKKNCFKKIVALGFSGEYIAFLILKVWFELYQTEISFIYL